MTVNNTCAHDEIHIGLDYIDEVARILVDAALNYDTVDPMTESRLYFLANVLEEASKRAREAARQLPGSPYNFAELVTVATTRN